MTNVAIHSKLALRWWEPLLAREALQLRWSFERFIISISYFHERPFYVSELENKWTDIVPD